MGWAKIWARFCGARGVITLVANPSMKLKNAKMLLTLAFTDCFISRFALSRLLSFTHFLHRAQLLHGLKISLLDCCNHALLSRPSNVRSRVKIQVWVAQLADNQALSVIGYLLQYRNWNPPQIVWDVCSDFSSFMWIYSPTVIARGTFFRQASELSDSNHDNPKPWYNVSLIPVNHPRKWLSLDIYWQPTLALSQQPSSKSSLLTRQFNPIFMNCELTSYSRRQGSEWNFSVI